MSFLRGVMVVCVCAGMAIAPRLATAQSQQSARVLVTVVDPSQATVTGATVTLIGRDAATTKVVIPPTKSVEKGVATFESVAPGLYSIQASFPGFDLGLVRDVTLRRGDNRRVIVLTIAAISETVNVGGGQENASNRTSAAFGLTLTQDAVATLSDDPDELARQIRELAGPDAIIRVDSFEGAQLPPKSQIKSVHVTRDQFAAEAMYPGSTFVDIITQPGTAAISGNVNLSARANTLAGASPFVSTRQPDALRNFNGTMSGKLLDQKSDFSVSLTGQNSYTTAILNQAGSTAQILNRRQPYERALLNAIFNHALTRDQTLRLGYAQLWQHQKNQGIGQYDSDERAFDSDFTGYQFRAQEAGPLGRRLFQNTRLIVTSTVQSQRSAVEKPTIIIQDVRTTGGAQVGGATRNTAFNFNSDVDYIRGIHSWRAGVQVDGGWFDSDSTSQYLGTYTFADEASFAAGKPLLYTRTIGNPRVKYFNAQTALYLQDDLRISKALTLSPGVRYMVQTHVDDWSGVAPRFGMTWAPFANGRTTLRSSIGIFYWPMEMGRVYEQTLRFDGNHQQQVIVVNPSYPDPGPVAGLPPNKYLLGHWTLQPNLRYSAGIDQAFSPRFRVNLLYAYWHQFELWRGNNINAPVNGVRPDPDFANVIEAITEGKINRHDVTVNLNMSLFTPGPAANQARFNWKRVSLAGTFATIHGRQHSELPFVPPPTGTIATEYGRMPEDMPYRITVSVISTQLRGLNVNVSATANDGNPYTWTTGIDDNLDGILNDRPAGVTPRSLRTASQFTTNLRVAYTLLPGVPAGTPGVGLALRRYRIGVTLNATNLTNHANYGGYSGVQTSPNFTKPTMVVNPRRVDMGVTIGF